MRSSTAQQMADYFAKQVMMGRGQWRVQLNPRDSDGQVANVVTPPAGRALDEVTKIVFVSIRSTGGHDGNS